MIKNHTTHRSAFDSALHGIDILQDIDLVLAPVRPTAEMIDAACRTVRIGKMQAQLVYEAMIRESMPDGLEDGPI